MQTPRYATTTLGYPRVGQGRTYKWMLEDFWVGKTSAPKGDGGRGRSAGKSHCASGDKRRACTSARIGSGGGIAVANIEQTGRLPGADSGEIDFRFREKRFYVTGDAWFGQTYVGFMGSRRFCPRRG